MNNIRLMKPYIGFDEVEQELKKIFEEGIFTRGKHVEAFRREISDYCGSKHAFLTTSATTALSVCLKLLGIGPGDEVIVSDFSFPATANVVEDLGGKPIFVDVSLDTYNISSDELNRFITNRTKAVIAVDAFGNPSGMHEIASICRDHNIPFIEDAACAIGSSEAEVRVGNIADLTCFSFHPRKLLTTGEGGAITTNRDDWAEWLDIKLNHGAKGMLGYALDFVEQGYNFRLSELQALMGRVQLKKIGKIVSERNTMCQHYIQRLNALGFLPQLHNSNVVHNLQSLVFRVPENVKRDDLIKGLREDGIETTIGTYCLSGTTFYKKRYNNVQKNSFILQNETITFPCYSDLDIDFVCDAIVKRSTK